MKTRFLFLHLVFLPIFSWAEGEDAVLENSVPQQMQKVSGRDNQRSTWNLVGYQTHQFKGFPLGKATGLPIEEQNRFVRVIAEAKPDQVIFVQGIADNNPWHNRAESEFRRLNFGVAMERARWAVDKARESFPEVSGKIKLLTPDPEHDNRGLNIYVATYKKTEKIGKPFKFPHLRVGVFTGTSFVRTKGMNFFVPMAGLLIKGNVFEISFFGGWRPTTEHRKDSLKGRAEGLVGADLTLHGDRWIGFSAGFNSAWETLRRHDDYMNRAVGFYIGPKFYLSSENFNFKVSPNFQWLKLNRYGRDDSWWNRGYGLSVELQRFFN